MIEKYFYKSFNESTEHFLSKEHFLILKKVILAEVCKKTIPLKVVFYILLENWIIWKEWEVNFL